MLLWIISTDVSNLPRAVVLRK